MSAASAFRQFLNLSNEQGEIGTGKTYLGRRDTMAFDVGPVKQLGDVAAVFG
jgi:hypothetical protein